MVVDVAEVLAQAVADLEHAALGDRGRRAEQRVHGAVEVGDLAAQQVDAVRRRGEPEKTVCSTSSMSVSSPSTTGA